MNKKIITATALITLTGILAGCARSLPAANDTTYRPPVETVKPQETQAASDMEHIILSDSKSDSNLDTAVIPSANPETEEKEAPETAKPEEAKKPVSTPRPTEKPTTKPPETTRKPPKPKTAPAATASLEITISKESEETEPTPQPEKPKPTKAPAATSAPTPEPTPTPQPEMEVMGGGFSSDVLDAINEARALQGNPALSLDGGLCAKALEHAKEMARQGKAFHSCGGVESVSDSSGGGRTIGARSAIHASDLELNVGLTSLGVGSVRTGDKQYTCVIGR